MTKIKWCVIQKTKTKIKSEFAVKINTGWHRENDSTLSKQVLRHWSCHAIQLFVFMAADLDLWL